MKDAPVETARIAMFWPADLKDRVAVAAGARGMTRWVIEAVEARLDHRIVDALAAPDPRAVVTGPEAEARKASLTAAEAAAGLAEVRKVRQHRDDPAPLVGAVLEEYDPDDETLVEDDPGLVAEGGPVTLTGDDATVTLAAPHEPADPRDDLDAMYDEGGHLPPGVTVVHGPPGAAEHLTAGFVRGVEATGASPDTLAALQADVPAEAAPEPPAPLCAHPKDKRRKLGYGTICGECGEMVR